MDFQISVYDAVDELVKEFQGYKYTRPELYHSLNTSPLFTAWARLQIPRYMYPRVLRLPLGV